MKPTVLLTKNATRAKCWRPCARAAKALQAGDFFFLTYSGHGGQVPDVQRRRGRQAGRDLVPVRRPVDRRRALPRAQPLRSRRAHPGAVRQLPQRQRGARRPAARQPCRDQRPKLMPPAVAMRTYDAAQEVLRQAAAGRGQGRGQGRGRSRRGAGSRWRSSGRLTAHRQALQARGHADLGLPGQPDLDGRRPQRRLHRAAAEGLEPGRVQGQLRRLPRAHQGRPAAEPVAEPVHARRGGQLPRAKPVHGLEPAGADPAADGRERAAHGVPSCVMETGMPPRHQLHRARPGAAASPRRRRCWAGRSRRRCAWARARGAGDRCACGAARRGRRGAEHRQTARRWCCTRERRAT